jgi:hypothetical protein
MKYKETFFNKHIMEIGILDFESYLSQLEDFKSSLFSDKDNINKEKELIEIKLIELNIRSKRIDDNIKIKSSNIKLLKRIINVINKHNNKKEMEIDFDNHWDSDLLFNTKVHYELLCKNYKTLMSDYKEWSYILLTDGILDNCIKCIEIHLYYHKSIEQKIKKAKRINGDLLTDYGEEVSSILTHVFGKCYGDEFIPYYYRLINAYTIIPYYAKNFMTKQIDTFGIQ